MKAIYLLTILTFGFFAQANELELERDLLVQHPLVISDGLVATPDGMTSALGTVPKCILINLELNTINKGKKLIIDVTSAKESILEKNYNSKSKEGKLVELLLNNINDLGGMILDDQFPLNKSKYLFSSKTSDGKKALLDCTYRSERSAQEVIDRMMNIRW